MRQVARYCGKVNYRSGCRNYFRKVIYSVREPGPSIRLFISTYSTVGIREPGISVTYIFKKVQPARLLQRKQVCIPHSRHRYQYVPLMYVSRLPLYTYV